MDGPLSDKSVVVAHRFILVGKPLRNSSFYERKNRIRRAHRPFHIAVFQQLFQTGDDELRSFLHHKSKLVELDAMAPSQPVGDRDRPLQIAGRIEVKKDEARLFAQVVISQLMGIEDRLQVARPPRHTPRMKIIAPPRKKMLHLEKFKNIFPVIAHKSIRLGARSQIPELLRKNILALHRRGPHIPFGMIGQVRRDPAERKCERLLLVEPSGKQKNYHDRPETLDAENRLCHHLSMIPRKITSAQHPLVKRLVKLRTDKSARLEENTVLVVGEKLVEELSRHLTLKTLITDRPYPHLSAQEVVEATPEILKKITGLAAPEGVAAEVPLPPPADLSSTRYLLILDGVSDPGNVGTLLRTALALGWDGVFLLPGSADPFNEKALRAAKGATFRLPICSGEIDLLKKICKGKKLFVADLQGQPPSALSAPLALVLGSESHGPSPVIREMAAPLAIPMSGSMESLNVATAGGILMYNLRRS